MTIFYNACPSVRLRNHFRTCTQLDGTSSLSLKSKFWMIHVIPLG